MKTSRRFFKGPKCTISIQKQLKYTSGKQQTTSESPFGKLKRNECTMLRNYRTIQTKDADPSGKLIPSGEVRACACIKHLVQYVTRSLTSTRRTCRSSSRSFSVSLRSSESGRSIQRVRFLFLHSLIHDYRRTFCSRRNHV